MKVAELVEQHRETALAPRETPAVVPNLEPLHEPVDYSHPVETARARQAFENYWNLGSGRTLLKLHEFHMSITDGQAPTKQYGTLRKWCHEHGWTERVMARTASQAEQSEAAVVEERAAQKKLRIAEAQGARSIGRQYMAAMMARIKAGDLLKMELLPHIEIVDGKPKKYPGLLDYADKALRLVEVGQKLERQETGEEVEGRFEALIEMLIMDMTPEEQREVRLYAGAVLAREKEAKKG